MDNQPFASYRIEDRSYASFIKREIHNLLTAAGFSTSRTGEIDIVVSELISNLIKHAGSGELLYRITWDGTDKAFEIFSLDSGPGHPDISRMMRDGASTASTLGHGLGSIQRLSTIFQIYSRKDKGTVAYSLCREHARLAYRAPDALALRSVHLPYPGERLSGDSYAVLRSAAHTSLFVADGLGHGENAHEAVQLSIDAFRQCEEVEPVEILRYIHTQVRKTRGLVGSVAILDHAMRKWKIAGIGNITTRFCYGLEAKNYLSHNGIIGLNIPNTMKSYEQQAFSHQFIIMCSDGLRTRWEFAKYPGLLKHDPAIIAGALFNDHARRTDDMSIVVGKVNLDRHG